MRHSQNIGKRERLERAAKRGEKQHNHRQKILQGRLMVAWGRTIEEHGITDFNDWVKAVNAGRVRG